MELIFYSSKDFLLTYDSLIERLNKISQYYDFYHADHYDDYIINLLSNIIHSQRTALIDYRNTSKKENGELRISHIKIRSLDHLIDLVHQSKSEIGIYSSGTEGTPKLIYQPITRFLQSVQIDTKYAKTKWAFTYNPSHSAGIQMMMQVLCNKGTLYDFYKGSRSYILETIQYNKIDYLSATPTFYRMLGPYDFELPNVKGITFNGEKSPPELINKFKEIAPSARIRNIYGSTESGPLMSSDTHEFIVPIRLLDKIKIEEDELFVHQSIVSKSINKNEEWYGTGDLVQVINDTPLTLVFVSRKSRIINVGGQNVNPQEIEEVLLQHPKILDAQVIPRPHALIGNLITARVKTEASDLQEAEVKTYLKEKLASYKIPRIITFVEEIKYGNTGKKLIR